MSQPESNKKKYDSISLEESLLSKPRLTRFREYSLLKKIAAEGSDGKGRLWPNRRARRRAITEQPEEDFIVPWQEPEDIPRRKRDVEEESNEGPAIFPFAQGLTQDGRYQSQMVIVDPHQGLDAGLL